MREEAHPAESSRERGELSVRIQPTGGCAEVMEAGQDGRVDLAPWIYKVVGPEGALEVTEVGRDALAEEEKGLP